MNDTEALVILPLKFDSGEVMPNVDFSADIAAVARIRSVPIILKMMKNMTGMRFSAVARVTKDHWVTCAVDDSLNFGLRLGDQLPVASTICHEIREHQQPVIFGDAGADEQYANHHTPETYKLKSYISMPIVLSNGQFFGTLCAIDSVSADLDAEVLIPTLQLFTELIATNLDMHASLSSSNEALSDATEAARLQDEFVAVLSHDLRSPLTAIQMSTDLLSTKLVDRPERRLLTTIRKSAERMGEMIENVLDLTRGRLGGGITVRPENTDDLQRAFQSVISEVRASHPALMIEQSISISSPVYCDVHRLCQLLSNLLGNAVSHGSRAHSVTVDARLDGTDLVIEVGNQGDPIPLVLIPQLFQPFTRSRVGSRAEGLGLGLYITAQIAKAHGGTVTVQSTAETGTCFTAIVPACKLSAITADHS